MKRIILLAVVLLAASVDMQAQLVKFGLKGGLNYANQNGSDITINSDNYQTDGITSYHVGLVAELKLTDGFSIQPELLYSCLLYTSPSPRDVEESRMPSSA